MAPQRRPAATFVAERPLELMMANPTNARPAARIERLDTSAPRTNTNRNGITADMVATNGATTVDDDSDRPW